MADRIYAGSIHWLGMTYENDPHIVQTRPVLILHTNGDTSYYYYITKREGKPHQHKYRPYINDWYTSGLKVPSYIMLKSPPKIADRADFKNISYIGDISQKDADNMSEYMDKLGY